MRYLTKNEDIENAIAHLASAKILWLDTEVADWNTPNPRLSLIQATANPDDITGKDAYILDVLDKPSLTDRFIQAIMIDPAIEKIFHNSGYDLKFLGRQTACNVTCTFKLSKKLSLEILGTSDRKLKTLAVKVCQLSSVDTESQASDWGKRPLSTQQLEYAKMDAVYLAQVYRHLLALLNPQLPSPENGSMSPPIPQKQNSLSVTKVRVAFECPRLFYLGHRFDGKMMFIPPDSVSRIGVDFHHLADRCIIIARQEPRFQALFTPEASLLNIEDLAPQMQKLFYELVFYPHLQATLQSNPDKVQALYQIWQGLQRLIRRWTELLIRNRQYCSAQDVIPKTLVDENPDLQHEFKLPDGKTQRVRGRFDSLIYDFECDRYCVLEYKTYISPDPSAQLAQAALYSYMLREKFDAPVDSAVYSVLPEWHELTFSWQELENNVHKLIPHKLQQMRQWIAWEPPQPNPPPATAQPDLLCPMCPQQQTCQTYFGASPTPSTIPRVEVQPSTLEALKADRTPAKINPPVGEGKPTPPTPEAPDADRIGQDLVKLLESFKIQVDYLGAIVGPAFIRVKLKPQLGFKVNSVLKLSDDLQVQLGIASAPLIAPQPGYVSIDLPRSDRQVAYFDRYIQSENTLPTQPTQIAIGVDLDGKLIQADLADPNTCHFLVGGTTGSGKSEFLRSLLLSLLYRHTPQQLQIALVDPKRVTFPEFEDIPWLYAPIVKESDRAIDLMYDLVEEMENRYRRFEASRCPDLTSYNAKNSPLPRIVCIFDEYADFMAEKDTRTELEQSIKRLGAMARAAGIHLIVATQRPEAGIVTPVIRSNLPGRVALRTSSEADSKIILGGSQTLAANLLGKGDLLYQVGSQLKRLQSLFAPTIHFP